MTTLTALFSNLKIRSVKFLVVLHLSDKVRQYRAGKSDRRH